MEYLEHNLKIELKKRRKNKSFFSEEKRTCHSYLFSMENPYQSYQCYQTFTLKWDLSWRNQSLKRIDRWRLSYETCWKAFTTKNQLGSWASNIKCKTYQGQRSTFQSYFINVSLSQKDSARIIWSVQGRRLRRRDDNAWMQLFKAGIGLLRLWQIFDKNEINIRCSIWNP